MVPSASGSRIITITVGGHAVKVHGSVMISCALLRRLFIDLRPLIAPRDGVLPAKFFHACSGPRVRCWVWVRIMFWVRVRVTFWVRVSVRVRIILCEGKISRPAPDYTSPTAVCQAPRGVKQM